jgi:hypothetical protein
MLYFLISERMELGPMGRIFFDLDTLSIVICVQFHLDFTLEIMVYHQYTVTEKGQKALCHIYIV